MTATLPAAEAPRNLPEFSVSELSAALKRTLEDAFAWVRVRGEVSGVKRHTSGHVYFALKDADSVLDAVCWRGTVQRLSIVPEDGMEVVASGRITTYGGRSKYQLVVESVELAGRGALLRLLEERKQRLAAEGLFAAERKRKLPYLPEIIGIVTSPSGAVIRDILHRLADRFPRRVLLWPVAVQGEGAAAQVAAAIAGFNRLVVGGSPPRPDLLIVARGGGSLEDLMAFNEEIVVRAAAASLIPLISAVGHETDSTLIDFASDRRAPTPSAAAEVAVPVRADLAAEIGDFDRRLIGALNRGLGERRLTLDGLERGLGDPRRLVDENAQRLDDRGERLRLAVDNFLARRRDAIARHGARLPSPHQQWAAAAARLAAESRALAQPGRGRLREAAMRLPPDLGQRLRDAVARSIGESRARLDTMAQLLDSMSYERVLDRGFVLARDKQDRPLALAAEARDAGDIILQFRDGEIAASVTPQTPRVRRRGGKPPTSDDQKVLL